MDYLPVFLDLRSRPVLVVGGGEVALRKIGLLLQAGADVRVVTRELHPELAAFAAEKRITLLGEEFNEALMDGAVFAIAATNDGALNLAVATAGRQRNIFVNVVDDSTASSCLMPSIVDRSPLIVAIGSGGNSPTLARRLRAQLETWLPRALGPLAATAGEWRRRVRTELPDLAARRRFWDELFTRAATLGAERAGDHQAIRDEFEQLLSSARSNERRGEVWLIGAGPGDPDLLTLRALQLLQHCDVVLYDRLVGSAVLDCVRRDAERVFVGKESGRHRVTQQRIHELLLEYASRGLRVVRLKGGDPLVFGRGGEELAAMAAAGIPVTVVPGVTAAMGGAAVAHIPLTHRGVAQSVTFVTAMGEAAEALDWRALAAPLQTAVFYMAAAQLPRIVEQLCAHGAPATRAVAIVERASLPGQRVVTGTLADIAVQAVAQGVAAPALLIVGEVVRQGRN